MKDTRIYIEDGKKPSLTESLYGAGMGNRVFLNDVEITDYVIDAHLRDYVDQAILALHIQIDLTVEPV